jgi:hypothetical protein
LATRRHTQYRRLRLICSMVSKPLKTTLLRYILQFSSYNALYKMFNFFHIIGASVGQWREQTKDADQFIDSLLFRLYNYYVCVGCLLSRCPGNYYLCALCYVWYLNNYYLCAIC